MSNRQHVVNKSPTWSPAGEAFTAFLMRVFPLDHRLTAAGEALAGRAGQTLARWLVLEAIQSEPATVADIARGMGQARQGVQRLANLLVGSGLARYQDNPRHRSASLLSITPDGAAALRRIQHTQRDWSNRLGAEIGEQELERASALMDRVLQLVTRDLPSLQELQR